MGNNNSCKTDSADSHDVNINNKYYDNVVRYFNLHDMADDIKYLTSKNVKKVYNLFFERVACYDLPYFMGLYYWHIKDETRYYLMYDNFTKSFYEGNNYAIYRLAKCYENINELDDAIKYYKHAINYGYQCAAKDIENCLNKQNTSLEKLK